MQSEQNTINSSFSLKYGTKIPIVGISNSEKSKRLDMILSDFMTSTVSHIERSEYSKEYGELFSKECNLQLQNREKLYLPVFPNNSVLRARYDDPFIDVFVCVDRVHTPNFRIDYHSILNQDILAQRNGRKVPVCISYTLSETRICGRKLNSNKFSLDEFSNLVDYSCKRFLSRLNSYFGISAKKSDIYISWNT